MYNPPSLDDDDARPSHRPGSSFCSCAVAVAHLREPLEHRLEGRPLRVVTVNALLDEGRVAKGGATGQQWEVRPHDGLAGRLDLI